MFFFVVVLLLFALDISNSNKWPSNYRLSFSVGKGRKKKHAAPRYVSNADELANRETAFNDQDKDRKARRKAAGCDDDDLDGGSGGASSMLDMATRRGNNESSDEEEVVKKVKKLTLAETIGLETASLNGKKKKNTMSKQDVANGNFEKATLSRREREVLEKDAAQRRYMKLTAEGKTDESKKDMARLKKMREKREKKKKKKEKEAKEEAKTEALAEAVKKSKKADQSSTVSNDDEKPTKIEIKKMKPAVIKEHLKRMGEDCQGNKKVITAKLLKACGY